MRTMNILSANCKRSKSRENEYDHLRAGLSSTWLIMWRTTSKKKKVQTCQWKAGNHKISSARSNERNSNIFQNFLAAQIIVPMRRRMDFCGTGHSWVNKF